MKFKEGDLVLNTDDMPFTVIGIEEGGQMEIEDDEGYTFLVDAEYYVKA
jgi:hypothetical protein